MKTENTTDRSGGFRVIDLFALAVFTILTVVGATPGAAQGRTTTDLLTFIRALEAPGGYDDYERRIPLPPPRALTTMRVGEVLNWQKRVRAAGAPATAAGGYQVIYKTLRRLVTRHGIAPAARFTPALQDRLARHLIDECGLKGPRARHPRYGNCLAGIWAALPLTSGPGKGRSAYYNLAGNRALTSPETLLALLAGQPVPLGPARAPGVRLKGGASFAVIAPGPPITYSDISTAMRGAARAGTLTPSVRKWNLDPYALQ